MQKTERILVIRHGALGDMVHCFQAFHEIRQAHPNAKIALLVKQNFADFARAMPWFDQIIIDPYPAIWRLDQWLVLLKRIYSFKPTRVYELHGKLRQDILFYLLGGPLGPKWSGSAPFAHFQRLWPPAPGMSFIGFLAAQLRKAGVPAQGPADLSWFDAPVDEFNLPARYAVLIPGAAPGGDIKRWPAAHYAELAQKLQERGITSVVVGTKQDADVIGVLKAKAPQIIDLSGKTNLLQLAGLFRRSVLVVGNDTGPMHMASALGARVLALLSAHTDPVWSTPPGPHMVWIKRQPVADISVDEVLLALAPHLDTNA
jgi:ADP-heptose:LPS heptosyltransferase